MPREELRARVFGRARAAVFERVADELAAAGRVRLLPDAVGLAAHEVRLSPGEQQARQALLDAAAAAGLAGVEPGRSRRRATPTRRCCSAWRASCWRRSGSCAWASSWSSAPSSSR